MRKRWPQTSACHLISGVGLRHTCHVIEHQRQFLARLNAGRRVNSGRRAGRGSLISTLLWRTQLGSLPMTGTLNKRASFVVRLPIGIVILFLVGPVETFVVSLLVS